MVLIAAITDIKTRKIYNWLTFPAAAVGIILNFVLGGWQEGLWSIGGWIIGVAIMVFPSMGKKHADLVTLNLMGAIGALTMSKRVSYCLFVFSVMVYGLVTVFVFAWKLPWKQMSKVCIRLFQNRCCSVLLKLMDLSELQSALKKYIPLGPIIAVRNL